MRILIGSVRRFNVVSPSARKPLVTDIPSVSFPFYKTPDLIACFSLCPESIDGYGDSSQFLRSKGCLKLFVCLLKSTGVARRPSTMKGVI